MTFALLLAALALGQSDGDGSAEVDAAATEESDELLPSDQSIIYFNARMALREGRAMEATKLWLLRNAVEDQGGRLSPHDPDFHSVTWAALGQMGICPDGYPTDETGVGLWPLALHNWVVLNRSRKNWPKRPPPFKAFEVGRQQRFISIQDVLNYTELDSARLFRNQCLRPRLAMLDAGESLLGDLSDRQLSGRLLLYLLHRSRVTLVEERVHGISAIEARVFDIHLKLAALAAREARQKRNADSRRGRELGLSRDAVVDLRKDAPLYTFKETSEPARILRESVSWPVSEWMALTEDRRLFLYDHAKAYGGDPAAMDAIALGVIDVLIDRNDGEELERWIAHRNADTTDQEIIWSGLRGRRPMGLDREAGFGERGVIALQRGVDALQRGDLVVALESIAYALQMAPESHDAEALQNLSLRWLSYVASQFEITDELLITLQELVPKRDYAIILEDLMWGAGFRADAASFERGIRHRAGRGALERRMGLLKPLANGDVSAFAVLVSDGMAERPSEIMRFLAAMVERLELENADVRIAQLPMLYAVRELIEPYSDAGGKGRQGRSVATMMERTQAIIEGLGGMGPDASSRDKARLIDPSGEVFAGSVRLAPTDAIPWPFRALTITAPSIFTPMKLIPVEWRDPDGELVYGWSIEG